MRRITAVTLIAMAALAATSLRAVETGGQLRFYLHSEPKTFDPLLVEDDAAETIRYLTGGTLLRIDRKTQKLTPELASAWKVSSDGRTITFTLRPHVYFSDGTPFSSKDVAYTLARLMDPSLHAPTADAFRSGSGQVRTTVLGDKKIAIAFAAPVAGLDRLFDQVAIVSSQSPERETAVLGPFYVADHKSGSYVLLKRNPNYWKRDEAGRQLPYLDSIRLEIQSNRDIELLRFERHDIDLINAVSADYYERLAQDSTARLFDFGPSLDTEQLWFNQVPNAPIAAYKREWFKSLAFRHAVSLSINRGDICRLVYHAHARVASGPVSPANRFWFDARLKPYEFDPAQAKRLLEQQGFQWRNGVLLDSGGHVVEFSIVTNSGNKARERMADMIQQDLARVGMRVNVVRLDMPSLIARISEKFNYEASLLGFVNDDLDPNAQMNVWLSSAENHQWNPNQKTPATAWEAELDDLMRAQASTLDRNKRKRLFDRVQEIVREQLPFIYLVDKDAISAVSNDVVGADPVPLRPETYWNAERLSLNPSLRVVSRTR